MLQKQATEELNKDKKMLLHGAKVLKRLNSETISFIAI